MKCRDLFLGAAAGLFLCFLSPLVAAESCGNNTAATAGYLTITNQATRQSVTLQDYFTPSVRYAAGPKSTYKIEQSFQGSYGGVLNTWLGNAECGYTPVVYAYETGAEGLIINYACDVMTRDDYLNMVFFGDLTIVVDPNNTDQTGCVAQTVLGQPVPGCLPSVHAATLRFQTGGQTFMSCKPSYASPD